VSLLYCVSSVFCFCICFILLLCGPVFLTHHASTAEDDESKRNQKSPSNEKENRKESYLVSSLSNLVSTRPKNLLVDSGASKNMRSSHISRQNLLQSKSSLGMKNVTR
jgi:hypothetical protein